MCVVAITKRAQFPISSWLPIAIRAPTPVRSLVHSSTLVVAGVWLLVKFRVLLAHRICVIPSHCHVEVLIGGVGLVTLFISSTIATSELDVKKIIALSTLRQVGFMFLISGLNLLSMSYFHQQVLASYVV
jgi:NADH-ubiquinone oxidoreductase chain 5